MEITFVSSSRAKRKVISKRAIENGLNINLANLELYEEQSMDVSKVAISKAMYAHSILKKPVFVDDRGLRIAALNNFPGALLKFAINTLGAEGIVKLMEKRNDRTAVFETAVAFMSSDLKKPIVFKSLEKGYIFKDVRKGKLRGWTDIIRVFSSPSFPNKALSEMDDKEWEEYQKELSKNDHITRFFSWIKKQNIYKD
ncbi:hypothetical protein M1112_02035 [Candidatus Parvarchaeota archaeon]|nr:hypothetical protein [Candidatus Parvarchaeota archaeon]